MKRVFFNSKRSFKHQLQPVKAKEMLLTEDFADFHSIDASHQTIQEQENRLLLSSLAS